MPTLDVIGRCHYEVFPDLPERWKEIHQRCLRGCVEKADEDPFPRLDGALDWVRWEIHPWYDMNGGIGGLLLLSEVITERKYAEEALRRYELLAANSRDIILFMRRNDGRILEANEAAAQAYGYSHEELLRLAIFDIRAPDTQALTAEPLGRSRSISISRISFACRRLCSKPTGTRMSSWRSSRTNCATRWRLS